jgi:phosphocarrier protein
MVEHEVEVVNELGLHARAAAKLVHLASSFACEVILEYRGQAVDAKSILGLLLLAAPFGSQVTLRCSGADEQKAIEELAGLFADRFGEPS